jgi:hypothetical protein
MMRCFKCTWTRFTCPKLKADKVMHPRKLDMMWNSTGSDSLKVALDASWPIMALTSEFEKLGTVWYTPGSA